MTGPAGRYPTSHFFRSHLGPTEVAAATATLDPVEDIALLEALEQDWSVACEYLIDCGGNRVPCGAPGSWWLICRECGHALAECSPHRAQEEQQLASLQVLFLAILCRRCGAGTLAPHWRDLFIVEPIGARS